MNFTILRVDHYGETQEENRRITLSPSLIQGLAAEVDDVVVQNRSLRKVAVLFADGGTMELVINHSDLELMERVVGGFLEPEV